MSRALVLFTDPLMDDKLVSCTGRDSLSPLSAQVSCRRSPTGFSPATGSTAAIPIPKPGGKGEERAIALTSPLPLVTCAAFAYLAIRLGLHSVSATVKLAVAIWLIGPLPLILTNAAFIKLHRLFVMSLSIGWLVKLTIIAVAVGWFLR
jgi:hypothetical protein